MRKRLRNVYTCLVGGCSENGEHKLVYLDYDDNRLFTLPTFICQCGFEPTLQDSKIISVKMEHKVDEVEIAQA